MRVPSSVAISLFCVCPLAFGQTETGSISGVVFSPAHNPTSRMAVEAKNVSTGTYYKTASSAKGEYTFAQLPVGTYEVSVLNLAFRPFVRKDLAVSAGGTQHVDIQLVGDNTVSTLGELQAYLAVAARRPAPPAGPAPKTADGKPDFTGVWMTPPNLRRALDFRAPGRSPAVGRSVGPRAADEPGARYAIVALSAE